MKRKTVDDLMFLLLLLAVTVAVLAFPACDRPVPPPPTPSPTPGPTPTPTPPPTPDCPIALGIDGHWITRNGKPWLISSYGNVVPAFGAQHDWRAIDIPLLRDGGKYGRLWDLLWGGTPRNQTPWRYNASTKKWDLNDPDQQNYWPMIADVYATTERECIALEDHIFDRGIGGSQAEYKESAWYPTNNVNNLRLPTFGPGTPEFYKLGNHRAFQLDFIEWHIQQICRPPGGRGQYRHVFLELENENRGDSETTIKWVQDLGGYIKNYSNSLNCSILTSFSTLDDVRWERAMRLPQVDVSLIHMNRECRDDPECLRSLMHKCWSFGKPCIVDEWANGEGNVERLRRTAWLIATSGIGSHIEDAKASANPFVATAVFPRAALGASASVRWFTDQSGWRFWEAEPKGPCMVSANESVCQSWKGERVPMRNREFRWYDPRSGNFGGWTATAESLVTPPSQNDWILQTR